MKSSLSLISFLIVKFMESRNDVKLDEKSGLGQMIEGLLQLGNQILVLDDDVIKFLVIHTYLNTSPRFTDKDH